MSNQASFYAHTGDVELENSSSREQESSEELAVEPPACVLPITDEQAERMLPGYALAFETYHQCRSKGMTPEASLMETLAEWRNFWNSTAYVPHRTR